jgi:hypothetical protein
MSKHDGGFTCAEVDAGSQHMAAVISRLRVERTAALRAYDAEVIGRREEVTRLHAELGQLRARIGLERAVLEAMAGIELGVLEAIRDGWSCAPLIFHPVCLAELALRTSKAGG